MKEKIIKEYTKAIGMNAVHKSKTPRWGFCVLWGICVHEVCAHILISPPLFECRVYCHQAYLEAAALKNEWNAARVGVLDADEGHEILAWRLHSIIHRSPSIRDRTGVLGDEAIVYW